MKNVLMRSLALIATIALSATSVNAQLSIDVNMAGWQSFGGFTNSNNSFQNVNIGAGSSITGVEFINFQFETLGASWRSELILSVEESTGVPFWDWRPASGLDSTGSFGPVTDAFGGSTGAAAGGAAFTSATGIIRAYVYETFDDGGAAVADAQIISGTLRIHYTAVAVPEPTSLLLSSLGLGLVGVVTGRRRRK